MCLCRVYLQDNRDRPYGHPAAQLPMCISAVLRGSSLTRRRLWGDGIHEEPLQMGVLGAALFGTSGYLWLTLPLAQGGLYGSATMSECGLNIIHMCTTASAWLFSEEVMGTGMRWFTCLSLVTTRALVMGHTVVQYYREEHIRRCPVFVLGAVSGIAYRSEKPC